MKIIFNLPEDKVLATNLANKANIELGLAEIRYFPDKEAYIRIISDVKQKTILLFCSLDHPNNKTILLFFMAKTLKELGAKKVCLISPYLPYMRQDKQFKSGEAVTSILFSELISSFIDSLITVDPHLHRIKNISEIYSIPTTTLHTTKVIAAWIKNNVRFPLIIGPDEESTQWVKEISEKIEAPFLVGKKNRFGDRKVLIKIPDIHDTSKTPVLIDDIISTGTTLCTIIPQLLAQRLKKPICIGIHALFNQKTYKKLLQVGTREIISCNTILHPSNKIDITDILIEGIEQC